MVELGLEKEARGLYGLKDMNALNTMGYKEFFNYFDNKISREKAIDLIKRNSRRYAKRQITWWAKEKDIKWFHPGLKNDIISYIEEQIKLLSK